MESPIFDAGHDSDEPPSDLGAYTSSSSNATDVDVAAEQLHISLQPEEELHSVEIPTGIDPIIQMDLPSFLHFFNPRSDVPSMVPVEATGQLQGGGQLHYLLNAPGAMSIAATNLSGIKRSSHKPASLTKFFINEGGKLTLLHIIICFDLREADGPGPFRDGVRMEHLEIKAKHSSHRRQVVAIVEIFLFVFYRGLEFSAARAVNGGHWLADFDARKGLEEVCRLDRFKTMYTEASKTVMARKLYQKQKQENWDFDPTTYRENAFIYAIMNNVILALDQFHQSIIKELRTMVPEIIKEHPFVGPLKIPNYRMELPTPTARRAQEILNSIRTEGPNKYLDLWKSEALQKLTNVFLRTLGLSTIARGMFKMQIKMELSFGVLALPSTILLGELSLLAKMRETKGHRLTTGKYNVELFPTEKSTWEMVGRRLVKLNTINLYNNPRDPAYQHNDLLDALASIVSSVSEDLDILSYYSIGY